MRLVNFSLRYRNAVELEAFGHNWDLHNCVDFRGLRFDPCSGDLLLEWVPLPEYAPNFWSDTENHAVLCRIRFSGLRLLRVGPREDAYPASESTCVSDISLVNDGGPERLVFTFQDERSIEVEAETAILERELPATG